MTELKNYLYDLTRLLHQSKDESINGKPKCFYCGKEFAADMDGFANINIEHLQSSHDGGLDKLENYVLSCRVCNSAKGKKSFEIGSPELEDFKKIQRRVSKLNDAWVKKLYAYMELEKYPGKEFYKDMLSSLEKHNSFKDVKEYKKSDGYWLEWKTRENDYWYFNLICFQLQPHFLFKKIKWGDETDETTIDKLYKMGYYCDHLMTKYLEPFDDVNAGVNVLLYEINMVYDVYDKMQ